MMTRRFVLATALAGLTAVLSAQQAPDRTHPPQPGPPPALNLPTIQKRQLSNGLPVWMVEMHEVPVAQVNLRGLQRQRGRSGGQVRRREPDGRDARGGRGIAIGARDRRRRRFPRRRSRPSSGIDASAVRLHVPVARLADALPIMADVALRPTFPKDELERLRRERLTNLLQARDDPPTIAALAFSRVLYGPAHRYGTATIGTGRDDQGVHAGRSPRVLCGGVSSRPTPRCSSSATWRRHA